MRPLSVWHNVTHTLYVQLMHPIADQFTHIHTKEHE